MAPRIDHVVVLVPDLDAAVAAAREFGFLVSGRGEHPHFGTANHLIVFRDCYIELLGIVEDRPGNAALRRRIEERPGVYGLAMATTDATGEQARLDACGFRVPAPLEFVRKLTVGDWVAEARFRVVTTDQIGDDMLLFYCEHCTPELVWRPELHAHPNGACGIDAVGVAVAEPHHRAALYSGFLDAAVEREDAGHARILLRVQSISLMDPTEMCRRLGIDGPDAEHLREGFVTLRPAEPMAACRALAATRVTDRPGRRLVRHTGLPGLVLEFPDRAADLQSG